MSYTPLSAQQLYDAGPLGALVRFSDGAVEPPARHRRKHAAWRSSNGTGRLVRKAPQKQGLPASFTLHVGDFGTADVTVVKAYRVFAVTSPLSFAILDKPRPGQVALIHDDLGMPTLVHLADTEADAQAWLAAHPRGRPSIEPWPPHPLRGKEDPLTTFNIYRVRFIQSQRYAINISAPSAELAEFFAEEVRKRAGTTPFEAISEPFGDDWQSEEICSANTPDLLAAAQNALDQLRRGGPRWTIKEALANALARAKAQGSVS